jgi:cyanophycinase-like exopeptidase
VMALGHWHVRHGTAVVRGTFESSAPSAGMSPSLTPDGATRGWIIPIGGGEEKENNPTILERFVTLCGGRDAKIVVMPTASKLHDTGDRYRAIFRDLGAAEVEVMDFDTRRDCDEPGAWPRSRRAMVSSSRAATRCGSPRCSAGRGGQGAARA